MKLIRMSACVCAAAIVGSVSAAAAYQSVSTPLPQPAEAHAASVDLPRIATLSHASPSTWHTLPPVPASGAGLNDDDIPRLLAWLSKLAAMEQRGMPGNGL
jgi:hypothetical protein